MVTDLKGYRELVNKLHEIPTLCNKPFEAGDLYSDEAKEERELARRGFVEIVERLPIILSAISQLEGGDLFDSLEEVALPYIQMAKEHSKEGQVTEKILDIPLLMYWHLSWAVLDFRIAIAERLLGVEAD